MEKHELEQLLSSDQVVAKIIRDIAELEFYLDMVLASWLGRRAAFVEFRELILSRLSFLQKIEILRRIPLPRRMVSQARAADSLEKLRRIRNILAHSYFLEDEDVHRLHSDNEIRRILKDYPKSYRREINADRNRLNRLIESARVRLS